MFYLTIKRINKNYLDRRLTSAELFSDHYQEIGLVLGYVMIIERFNIDIKYYRGTSKQIIFYITRSYRSKIHVILIK